MLAFSKTYWNKFEKLVSNHNYFNRKEHENSEDHQDEVSYVKTAKLSIVHKKFCLELHEQCVALKTVAEKFNSIASEIEAIQEKATAVVDLANLSNSQVVKLVK